MQKIIDAFAETLKKEIETWEILNRFLGAAEVLLDDYWDSHRLTAEEWLKIVGRVRKYISYYVGYNPKMMKEKSEELLAETKKYLLICDPFKTEAWLIVKEALKEIIEHSRESFQEKGGKG